MKMKKVFIIPMMAPIFMAQAQAELPDEINYTPYEIEYNRLADEVSVVENSLKNASESLQNAYNSETQIYNSIDSIQSESQNINNQINSYEDRRIVLNSNLDILQEKIDDLNTRLNRLEREKRSTDNDIRSEDRRLQPIRDRIAELDRELKKASNAVRSERENLNRADAKVNQLANNVQSLRQTRKQEEASLKNLESSLVTIDKDISDTESQIPKAEQKVKRLEKKLATDKSEANALNDTIKAKQDEMKALMAEIGNPRTSMRDPRVIAIRQELVKLSQDKKVKDAEVSASERDVKRAVTEVSSLKTSLQRLVRSKATLPNQIQAAKNKINSTIAQIDVKKSELDNATTHRDSVKLSLADKLISENETSRQLERANERYSNQSTDYNRLVNEYNAIERRISNVSENLRVATYEFRTDSTELSSIEDRLPNLRRTVRDNTLSLQRLDNDLVVVQEQIVQLNSDVTKLSSELTMITTKRDRKYTEYISRFEYYGEKLSEAKTIGASQSDIAINVARTDSDLYTAQRSNELGSQIGQDLGFAQSSLWAAVRSEIKGYHDGYNEGYASEADLVRGREEGTIAGMNAAIDFAQSTLKPQFFNEIFNSTLNGVAPLMPKAAMTSAEMSKVIIETQQKMIKSFSSSISPITSSEINQSNSIETDLDVSIESYKKSLMKVSNEVTRLSDAVSVYVAPTSITLGSVNCHTVYKSITEFISACKNSYADTYRSKYSNEHFENFKAQYKNLYQEVVAETQSKTLDSNYEADYDNFYPTAKASGLKDGKNKIYKEAYSEAHRNSYNAELPKATTVARVDAQTEVTQWISTNATLTNTTAIIEGPEFIGGANVTLNLGIKNISAIALNKPVKVKITNVKNARISNDTFYIKSAGGNSVTMFKDINFDIIRDTRSNQEVIVSGLIYLPGGKYESERVEKFEAKVLTALNPAAKLGFEYDGSPKIRSTFGRTYIHNFDVNVSPEVESVQAGYTVELSANAGSEQHIVFKNTSVNTGSVNYGQTNKAKFQYTLNRSADNKTVEIKVLTKYKGKIIDSKIVELRPH